MLRRVRDLCLLGKMSSSMYVCVSIQSLGQLGRVESLVDDCSVVVKVNGRKWILDPRCLVPTPGEQPEDEESEYYKWKNHFYEMKGDVWMSLHEKERKKMPTPRHKTTHNPIPTSLFCFNMLFCLLGKANSTIS